MRYLHKLFPCLFLIITTLTDTMSADQTSTETSNKKPEVKVYPYHESGSENLVLEVYTPKGLKKNSEAVPGIIMFHGGGWRGGNRSQFKFLCDYFARRGLVTATVTYTLGKGKEKCVQDAITAIRWFKENSDRLGVDPNRIIAGGGSAGGHISLLATTNPGLNPSKNKEDTDTSVVAYLLFNPALIIKDAPEVNFMEHVSSELSPSISFFGDKDTKWLKGWDAAMEKMKSLGVNNVEYFQAEGESHAFFNKTPWKELTILACDNFLNRQGLLTGEPTLNTPLLKKKLVRATDK